MRLCTKQLPFLVGVTQQGTPAAWPGVAPAGAIGKDRHGFQYITPYCGASAPPAPTPRSVAVGQSAGCRWPAAASWPPVCEPPADKCLHGATTDGAPSS